nr:NAD(P)-binding domain-containing protein [Gloeobacter violaceus]
MQLGMIGLGRMGANIVRRLLRHGHECVVYNRTAEKVLSAVRFQFGEHTEHTGAGG